MLQRFREHLSVSGLIPDGVSILVGYSGGADSTCLLHLLHQTGIPIVAAHLHHGQRFEAETELKLCQAFAESLNVPFVSGRADVPRLAQDMGIGLEEAGRNARYGFFQQAAYQTGCDLIATAHTRDDHVETILFNIARGTGITGLAGIPERRDSIIRPLLPFTRQETRDYCEDQGFWYHDDPANSDLSFSRARIRHRVLPELRQINGAADASITRLSKTACDEDRFLNGMAAAALEQAEISLNGDLSFLTSDVEISFRRSQLETLPAVLFRRAIRLAFEALGAPIDYEQTLTIQERIVSIPRGSITAEGGTVVGEWTEDALTVRSLIPSVPYRYSLTVPGETISDEFGWKFVAQEKPFDQVFPVRASLQTSVDPAQMKGSLYFRTVKPGDAISPLGFPGTRKLSDLMSEAGLTLAARSRLPIVCDMIGPIWIPGVALSDRVKPKPDTIKTLAISFEPLGTGDVREI